MNCGRSLQKALGPLMLALSLAAHAQGPAPSPARADLLRELAGRIVAVTGVADPLVLSASASGAAADLLGRALDADLAASLRARGVRTLFPWNPTRADGQPEGAWGAKVTCADTVTHVVCSAELARAGSRSVVLVSRARTVFERPDADSPFFALVTRPLFAQRRPVLDAAMPDDRHLLVLDAEGATLYEASPDGWRRTASLPISPPAWPRDPRGRLAVNGNALEAFVPGLACRGTVDPLSLSCEERREAWPIALENGGLSDARNFFTSPRTEPFYAAAPLSPDGHAGTTAWAVTGVDGKVHVLSGTFQEIFTAGGYGDEAVSLDAGCGPPGKFLVLSLASGEHNDALRAFDASGHELIPVSSAHVLPGRLAALWPSSRERATAVVRNLESQRYEVYQVELGCSR